MTSNPGLYLPVELIEPIIIHAGRYSSQDLHSLSLVSKVWTPIAQSLLFSSVEIHPQFIHTSPAIFCGSDEYDARMQLRGFQDPLFFTIGTPSQFQHLLEIAPHIPKYTRHLKLGYPFSTHSLRKDKLASGVQAVIPTFLSMCTKIESLRIEFCYWDIFQAIYEPLFAALRGYHELKYLSLICVTFPDVVYLVGLLENCASLETLVLNDVVVHPEGPYDASVSPPPLPLAVKASRPLYLRSLVIFSDSSESFSTLVDALSIPSSPVNILHVRGLSLACPWLQLDGINVEVTNRTVSVLRRLQRHTLEHLSVPVTIPPVELSSLDFIPRLKSLRVSSRFLSPCIPWLTQVLESGAFLELTAITIDVHLGSAWFIDPLILKDKDKDDWRAFGTVLRTTTSRVEIVRLYVDNFSDFPAQEDFEALLAGEGLPVLTVLGASE